MRNCLRNYADFVHSCRSVRKIALFQTSKGVMISRSSPFWETVLMEIEVKRFDVVGQLSFAELSGDFNPIHIDRITARRLMFGQPVVHGVHTLLWMLDRWLTGQPAIRIRSLRSDFRNPARLHQDVSFLATPTGEGQVCLEATTPTAGLVRANVKWRSADRTDEPMSNIPAKSPAKESAQLLLANQISSAAGSLPLMFDRALAAAMFPNASAKLPGDQFAALLASTRVVGMRVPGLHSLLNALNLEDSSSTSGQLAYSVEEFDERFSRAIIHLRGDGLSGTATAFLRPTPVAQAGFTEASRSVTPGEFAKERVIVIGGSRGLGEIAVKQLTAGGASVKFSYHVGEDDALRLAAELGADSPTSCFQLDVLGDMGALKELCRDFAPTMVCYFSTPPITGAPRGKFSTPLFHELCQIYVEGFLRVFTAASSTGKLTSILQPSSVAIDETPFGMTEYSAAKAAAETLLRALQKSHPKIRFHAPRWGRMPTDLTASITPGEVVDPVPVVLAALRQMKSTP